MRTKKGRAEAERLTLIGVAENLDTNSHVHAAAYGQETLIDFLLSEEAKTLWRQVHERCDYLHVARAGSTAAMAAYITKHLYQANSIDRAVFYSPRQLKRDVPGNH